MFHQMGIFTSRHADHVEKRVGARDGAMPFWISTWSQENPPLGLEIQCHFDAVGMWKMIHLGLGKFQMKIFTCVCVCFKKYLQKYL